MAYAVERHCVVRAGKVKRLAEIHAARPAAFKRSYPNSAKILTFLFLWRCGPTRVMASSFFSIF
jgi:hypothetical protein